MNAWDQYWVDEEKMKRRVERTDRYFGPALTIFAIVMVVTLVAVAWISMDNQRTLQEICRDSGGTSFDDGTGCILPSITIERKQS